MTWDLPGEDWLMGFTQIPVSQGYEYLLVMIDTFTGWTESFPTQIEMAGWHHPLNGRESE